MTASTTVEALVLTHGHEDHIGAAPYLLRERRDIPLVGSQLTLALLGSKLREHRIKDTVAAHRRRGRPDHASAPSTSSSSRSTTRSPTRSRSRSARGAGMVLHTGDFKMDQLPLDGRITDLRAFARLGEEGVDLFLTDSTNAEVPGFTTSEKDIAPVLDRVFHTSSRQRIIVACFASHVHRVQQVMDAAASATAARWRTSAARWCATWASPATSATSRCRRACSSTPRSSPTCRRDKVVLISTGSQGEPLSALARIAQRNHNFVTSSTATPSSSPRR